MRTTCMVGLCQNHYLFGFDWIEALPKIDKNFIKNYNKDSDKGYILEVDVKYPKMYIMSIAIYL